MIFFILDSEGGLYLYQTSKNLFILRMEMNFGEDGVIQALY